MRELPRMPLPTCHLRYAEHCFDEPGAAASVAAWDEMVRAFIGTPHRLYCGLRCVGSEVRGRLPDGRRRACVFYLGLVEG